MSCPSVRFFIPHVKTDSYDHESSQVNHLQLFFCITSFLKCYVWIRKLGFVSLIMHKLDVFFFRTEIWHWINQGFAKKNKTKHYDNVFRNKILHKSGYDWNKYAQTILETTSIIYMQIKFGTCKCYCGGVPRLGVSVNWPLKVQYGWYI